MPTPTHRINAGIAAVFLVASCSAGTDAGDIDSTIDDAVAGAVDEAEAATDTTLTPANADAVAKLQTSMDLVSAQIEESDLEADLSMAWTEIQARISDVSAGADLDPSALRTMLDAVETQVDLEANPEFEAAWTEFRADFEAFLTSS